MPEDSTISRGGLPSADMSTEYSFHTLRHDADVIQEGAWVIWQCRSVFSHRKRRKRFEWVPIDSHLSDTYPVPKEEGYLELLGELAVHLNEQQRHTLTLILHGYTIKEIAETLNIKPDSVKKQRQRIIEKMRQAYRDIYGQNDDSHEHTITMNGKTQKPHGDEI